MRCTARALEVALPWALTIIRLVRINNAVGARRPWLLASMILRVPCVAQQRGPEEHVFSFGRFMASRLCAIICISESIKDNLFDVRGVPLQVIRA